MDSLQEVRQLLSQHMGKLNISNREELLQELTSEDEIPIELAFTVLLVDLAMIDQNFEAREYGYIFSTLGTAFNLSDAEIKNLIKNAKNSLGSFRGPRSFATRLAKTLSEDQRQDLGRALEVIVYFG